MQEMQEMWVWSLGQEDPLEEELATLSSIHAWRIPWTEQPGGPQSIGLQRARHDQACTAGCRVACGGRQHSSATRCLLSLLGQQCFPPAHSTLAPVRQLLYRTTAIFKVLNKQDSSRKTSISALMTTPKPLTVWITINCGKFWKRWEYQPPDLPLEKPVCRSGSNS